MTKKMQKSLDSFESKWKWIISWNNFVADILFNLPPKLIPKFQTVHCLQCPDLVHVQSAQQFWLPEVRGNRHKRKPTISIFKPSLTAATLPSHHFPLPPNSASKRWRGDWRGAASTRRLTWHSRTRSLVRQAEGVRRLDRKVLTGKPFVKEKSRGSLSRPKQWGCHGAGKQTEVKGELWNCLGKCRVNSCQLL